jgi:hypothetical protein
MKVGDRVQYKYSSKKPKEAGKVVSVKYGVTWDSKMGGVYDYSEGDLEPEAIPPVSPTPKFQIGELVVHADAAWVVEGAYGNSKGWTYNIKKYNGIRCIDNKFYILEAALEKAQSNYWVASLRHTYSDLYDRYR